MTWPKQLSHYLFSFSFSFLSTRKSADAKQLKRDAWEFINRSKHRRCISSVPQLNGNSIEFSLSTQTRSVIKSPQAKSLQDSLSHRPDHDMEKGDNEDETLLKEERFRMLTVERGKFWKELEDVEECIEEEVKTAVDEEREGWKREGKVITWRERAYVPDLDILCEEIL